MEARTAGRAALKPHADTTGSAVDRITVEVVRSGALLTLRYVVEGGMDRLYWPEPAASVRTDELWRRTCFEAFVRVGNGTRYAELNLSPSTRWAAYRFDGYRAEMADADVDTPDIAAGKASDTATLTATVALDRLSFIPADADWRLGLSAVIEDVDGETAYWALTHPSPFPDFHHADAFAFDLPVPEPA